MRARFHLRRSLQIVLPRLHPRAAHVAVAVGHEGSVGLQLSLGSDGIDESGASFTQVACGTFAVYALDEAGSLSSWGRARPHFFLQASRERADGEGRVARAEFGMFLTLGVSSSTFTTLRLGWRRRPLVPVRPKTWLRGRQIRGCACVLFGAVGPVAYQL